jgi:hypothetical protein
VNPTTARWNACAIGLLTASLLAGCSPAPPAPPSAGTSRPAAAPTPTSPPPAPRLPRPDDVDDSDPGAVSAAALTALWHIDTLTDTSPRDAITRAGPWLAPAYLHELQHTPAASAIGHSTWQRWTAHRAYTRITLRPGGDQRAPDTPTTAERQWRLTRRPIGRDGWAGPPEESTVFAALHRPAPKTPWRVTALATG